jgi:hypothetical protein
MPFSIEYAIIIFSVNIYATSDSQFLVRVKNGCFIRPETSRFINIGHTTFFIYFLHQVPMAEAMEKFTLDFNCRTILIDVVREIDRVDVKEMSRDTSGTRAFSQFLVEVAERLPEQLQPCLVLLMKHLVIFKVIFSMVSLSKIV